MRDTFRRCCTYSISTWYWWLWIIDIVFSFVVSHHQSSFIPMELSWLNKTVSTTCSPLWYVEFKVTSCVLASCLSQSFASYSIPPPYCWSLCVEAYQVLAIRFFAAIMDHVMQWRCYTLLNGAVYCGRTRQHFENSGSWKWYQVSTMRCLNHNTPTTICSSRNSTPASSCHQWWVCFE